MGQFGVYDVHLNDVGDNAGTNCTLSTAKEPVDVYARKDEINSIFLIPRNVCIIPSTYGSFRKLI